MILSNYTIEDINEFEGYDQSKNEDLFTKLNSDIEDLYESNKLIDKISNYNIDNIDFYYNHTCQTFFDNLFIENEFLKHLPAMFKKLFIKNLIIQLSKFKYFENNRKVIFKLIFFK